MLITDRIKAKIMQLLAETAIKSPNVAKMTFYNHHLVLQVEFYQEGTGDTKLIQFNLCTDLRRDEIAVSHYKGVYEFAPYDSFNAFIDPGLYPNIEEEVEFVVKDFVERLLKLTKMHFDVSF